MLELLIVGACIVGLAVRYARHQRRRYQDMFAMYEACSRVLPSHGIRSSTKAEGLGSATRPLGPQSDNEGTTP